MSEPPRQKPLLAVRDITAYYGDFQALWGVHFDVFEGEVVALLGSNGAGKTTLLRVLSGLVGAGQGTVQFRGEDIANRAAAAIVELGIAHVPEGRQLFVDMSVEENLLVGSHIARCRPRRAANLAKMYSTFPRLAERRKQRAGTLSGGEQQMLAIGRALMSEPTLLLLDEPSLGLSPLLTEQTLAAIKDITRTGLTAVIVEQKVAEGLAVADRGYVIENGRLVSEGTSQALMGDPQIRAAYLGL